MTRETVIQKFPFVLIDLVSVWTMLEVPQTTFASAQDRIMAAWQIQQHVLKVRVKSIVMLVMVSLVYSFL
jgi:hypothetical protein